MPSGGGDEIVGSEEGLEGAGVGPPAVEVSEAHGALGDVGVVDVGDLEFAAVGALQLLDLVENRLVVHINAGDGEVGFGIMGLFLDAEYSSAFYLGDAEPFGVGNLLEEDLGARRLPTEIFDRRADGTLNDVVAEDDAQAMSGAEVMREPERFSDATFAFLVGVVEMDVAELFAVGKEAEEVPGVASAGDNKDLINSRVDKRLDRVIDHRLVVDREQMFVCDLC